MIILISLLILIIAMFATPYIVNSAELRITTAWGALLGATYSSTYDEEDKARDHYFQVALFAIIFTLIWTSEDE